jgi:hypothetical protein
MSLYLQRAPPSLVSGVLPGTIQISYNIQPAHVQTNQVHRQYSIKVLIVHRQGRTDSFPEFR